MKKWQKSYIVILLLVYVIALFGCSRTRIIDKISIVHVFGFDQADNGEIVGTALFPEYTKSKSGDRIQYLEEQAATSVLVATNMAKHSSTPVEVSKIRVLVLGKKYADSGIQTMVERFITIPQLGTNIQIVVSTHSARETLNKFRREKSLTLAERIEHNMLEQSLPKMNLHVFLNSFYGEGMDAYVPMITIDEKDTIKIDGVGIFKDDKFKLHLNPEQTIFFSILKDYRNQATLKIALNEKDPKEVITVRAFRNKSNWDWDRKLEQLHLNLHLEWTIVHHPQRFNLENSEDVSEIKKIISDKIAKGIEDLITTFKENEVDPLGIGNIVRSKDRTWEKDTFYKKYSSLPINVNVDLEIIHSGLED